MPHFLIAAALVLLSALALPAQSFQAFVKAGDQAMREQDYHAALHHYEQALEKREDPAVWYASGRAAMLFQSYPLAVSYFNKLKESPAAAQFPEMSLWLGSCLVSLGRYADARPLLQAFLGQQGANPQLSARGRLLLSVCDAALAAESTDPQWTLSRLGRGVNTPFSEFGAAQTGDSLFFSSYRFDWPKDRRQPPRKQARLLLAKGQQGRGRPLARGFQVDTLHMAHTAFSPDGQRLYFTVCRFKGEGAVIQCQLCYRERDRRGRWKADYVVLPSTINLPGFTTTQPTVVFDSLLRRSYLLFTSDRPGGLGGLDLWQAAIPGPKESWGEPRNLSDLNTPFDELTPYFHQPSQRLFFSSDGYVGRGGYDVFETRRGADSLWQEPVNLGPDINSSYNEVYYFLQKDGLRGYLSSNRVGGAALDERSGACCLDIFAFDRIPPRQVRPETPTEVVTALPDPLPTRPAAPVYRELSDFLPLALYFDNDEPDKRTRRTTTRQAYGTTYQRYYPRREEYRERYTQGLPEEKAEASAELVEAFFEEEVRGGYEKLERFSEILLERLEGGNRVEIFLKGFTSPRAQSDYNLALGQRRVSSARLHFDSWREGIFATYIASGQLVISEVSFGETQAATGVADALEDERASIYSPAAARERRVEIVEVKEQR